MGKRGRASNFNEEEWEYLTGQFPTFKAAQRLGTVTKFFATMEFAFFERFPVGEGGGNGEGDEADGSEDDDDDGPSEKASKRAGKAVLTRRQQLQAWFYNYSTKLKKSQDTVLPLKSGSLAGTLFKAGGRKKTRRLQQVEIFQKRNKDAINAALKHRTKSSTLSAKKTKTTRSRGASSGATPRQDDIDGGGNSDDNSSGDDNAGGGGDDSDDAGSDGGTSGDDDDGGKVKAGRKKKGKENGGRKNMGLRRTVAQEMLELASEGEKEAVRREYVKQKPQYVEDASERPVEERDPEEIQGGIDELPGILNEVHEAIARHTGLVGYTVLVGPSPEDNGDIVTRTFCSGQTLIGQHNFPAAYGNWNEVLTATGQWGKKCFTRETRAARALQPKAAPVVQDLEDDTVLGANPHAKLNGLPKKLTKKQLKAQKDTRRAAAATTTTTSPTPQETVPVEAAAVPDDRLPASTTPLSATTLDGLLPFDDIPTATSNPLSENGPPAADPFTLDPFNDDFFDPAVFLPHCDDPNAMPPWYNPPVEPSASEGSTAFPLPAITTVADGSLRVSSNVDETSPLNRLPSPNPSLSPPLLDLPQTAASFAASAASSQTPSPPQSSPTPATPTISSEERSPAFPLYTVTPTSLAATPARHRRHAQFSPRVSSPLAVHPPTARVSSPSATARSPTSPPEVISAAAEADVPASTPTASRTPTPSPAVVQDTSDGRPRMTWAARKEEWRRKAPSSTDASTPTPPRPRPKTLPRSEVSESRL
ncbi:hypothetical protein R3P38DRAFT_2812747 [Favolaschia claudopus]|uniref:Uncharacterized protein n=1 Tax=Favolaschia claudopus TaxID=2862362 RepID=A0AAV9Z603_9AGAR